MPQWFPLTSASHCIEIMRTGTEFPRIIAGAHYFFWHRKGAIIRRKTISRGRQLFQIFLTEGHALNVLFYYTEKLKLTEIALKPLQTP